MTFTGSLLAGKHQLSFAGGRVHLMGVLNLSPESKNTPTVAMSVDDALAIAERHRSNGASIIDVGAQSSHFDNPDLDPSEEIGRLAGTVERLVAEDFLVSVDTWKPAVASAAVDLGASIINDTGGLQDPEMVRVVGEAGVAGVAMYLEGDSPLAVGKIDIDGSLVEQMIRRLAGWAGQTWNRRHDRRSWNRDLLPNGPRQLCSSPARRDPESRAIRVSRETCSPSGSPQARACSYAGYGDARTRIRGRHTPGPRCGGSC